MNLIFLAMNIRVWLALMLALVATSALAQFEPSNVSTSTICDDRLALKWAPSSGAQGYRVSLVTEDGEQVVCDGTDPSCTVRKLKPGKSYSYYVDKKTDDGLLLSREPIRVTGPNMAHCVEGAAIMPPTPRPPVDTCAMLPSDVAVMGFRPFAAQCQRLGAAGVTNTNLIGQGILDAIDVWGVVDSEVRVCFRQPGRLKFLDAATAPRAVEDLAAETIEGMTCGRIDRAGTVALMPGSMPALMPEQAQAGDDRACTRAALRVRSAPSMEAGTIGFLRRGVGLSLISREGSWLEIEYDDIAGWVGAAYVNEAGGCGAKVAPAPAASQQSEPGCVITTHHLKLRAEPSMAGDVIDHVPRGTTLKSTARNEYWVEVAYEGKTGWIGAGYVTEAGDCG